ncbi:hypothetical protein CEXT_752051 [Caerostris extrusa]|uniref:Uncharacterized protein n=1 Tax=Caerostris extrusa TaxID=172846 RepID=A0AAV4Y7N5_CAEEX|nr:hypothetical protein CEXT_752051 [Caerostris extrusa]
MKCDDCSVPDLNTSCHNDCINILEFSATNALGIFTLNLKIFLLLIIDKQGRERCKSKESDEIRVRVVRDYHLIIRERKLMNG